MSGAAILRLFSFFLLFCANQLFAQPLSFRHLTTAQGLLSDQRINLAEDRIGRIWIASDEGVNVFDGQELISYSYPDNSGLLHNNVTSIFCDSKGTIWISHNMGVQFLPEGEQAFHSVTLPGPVNNEGLIFAEIPGGILIVSRSGSFIIDNNYRCSIVEGLTALIQQFKVPTCMEQISGDEWLWGCVDSLRVVNVRTQQALRSYPFPNSWALRRVNDDQWMVGSFSRDDLALLSLSTGELSYINHWKTNDNKPIGAYAGAIQRIDDHRFAIASRYFGIYIIDIKNQSAEHLMHDGGNASSILTDYCRSLFISRDGTLFVHSRGLSYAPIKASRLRAVSQLTDKNGFRYSAVVNCFLQDHEQRLWIGTNTGLYQQDKNGNPGNTIRFLVKEDGEQRAKTIRHIAMDAKQRIWAGTFGAGLGKLENDKFIPAFTKSSPVLPAPYPSDIYAIIPYNNKFLLCANYGFTSFDPLTGQPESYVDHPALGAIARHRTYYALIDSRGNWWLAQREGLFHYNTYTHQLTTVPVPGQQGDQSIQTVAEDSLGNVYAGGYTGLYIYRNGYFKDPVIIRKKDGLSSSNITGLICDKKGDMWIIGNRGLARYRPVTRELQSFDEKDGLLAGNHKFSSYYLSSDGTVYLGSEDGYNYFHPDSLGTTAPPLKAYITELVLQDTLINTMAMEKLLLPWHENNLQFRYLAVDHKTGPYLQYRYKLTGIDSSYVYAGRQRTVRYTNLKPGDYTFNVEVSANGKDWYAAKPLELHIAIAFWNTTWFRIVVLVGVLLLAYTWYNFRIRQVRKQAQMKADYEIRLNDLENSALRAQMNPHFIFNCLNTINAFVSRNEKTLANQYISRFSKLIRMILDHSRQRKISLEEELEALELYLKIEQVRFEGRFDYSIIVDDSIDTGNTAIPGLLIQPFAENAILHGLLPAKQPGLLKISISKTDNLILIAVEDNGVGRAAAAASRADHQALQKSHGTDITWKRVALFNKEHGVEIEPAVVDLIGEEGIAKGTRVEIGLFEESVL
ncbi:ligand-binding sensor domain-containing protein [Pseudoflavitalea rhizosphaerae]|uniref:ligand-binding sensor domain-containing protein n=1 Tax=Pseudoflavitalea rhizosphaerae TaxID=1884793 RepID=UPI000F8C905C|nr:histidine kinase [Pseudoflavitalea rhizosphaerae]